MSYEFDRFIFAFFVGCCLHISGSVLQLVSRNHLAAPSTLGFAAPGILLTLFFYFFFPSLMIAQWLWPLLLFFLIFCWLVIHWKVGFPIANRYRSLFQNFILIGLAVNLLLASLIALLEFILQNQGERLPMQLWFGSIKVIHASQYYTFVFPSVVLLYFAFLFSQKLKFLFAGSDFALGLGVNLRALELQALLLSLVASTLVIIHYGIFAFMGLITPVLIRQIPFFAHNAGRELMLGAMMVGGFLAVVDYLCYEHPIAGAEIPVGLISAILGPIVLIVAQLKTIEKTKEGF